LEFSFKYAVWALILGALSAVSLPIGSLIGVTFRLKPFIAGFAAAFGAGALFAALSIELVAETMLHAVEARTAGEAGWYILPLGLILGCAGGGLLFVALDQLIAKRGGYLRKTATAISYFSKSRQTRHRRLFDRLGQCEVFRSIPPENSQMLFDCLKPALFNDGEFLFHQGEMGDKMYFIEDGAIDIINDGIVARRLGVGDILGEIAVIVGTQRTAGARANGDVKTLELAKQDFQRLQAVIPGLKDAVVQIASRRLEEISVLTTKSSTEKSNWAVKAAQALKQHNEMPTPLELRQAASRHSSAPLAIWLGIFLDGIPESFVIGASFLMILTSKMHLGGPAFGQVVPWTLIAGLFLSNFPEAMSSSAGMRHQGWKTMRILWLWISLMVMTGIGAAIGYGIGADVSPTIVIIIEGLAAGAMLTMIAQTMIPEAVHLSGPNIVGLSTLFGFLSTVAFKFLE